MRLSMSARRPRRRGRLFIFALVACASVVAAVSATAVGSGRAGQTLTIAAGDFLTLNFLLDARSTSQQHTVPLYDRLLARGAADKTIGYLASSWKCTTKVCTFQLRKGASCSDGTAVTPEVVAGSLKAQIEKLPKVSETRNAWWGPGPYAVSFDAKKWTVTFRVGTPYGSLADGFAWHGASIACPAAINNPDPNFMTLNAIGSGPYKLVSITRGDQTVYQKRPEWKWGPNKATAKDLPDTLVIRAIANQTTAANLIVTGGADIAQISGPDVDRLLADRSVKSKRRLNYFPAFLYMSQWPGRVTNDLTLRRALMTAVDDKNWLQAAFSGHGVVAPALIGPGTRCYNPALIKKHGPKGGIDAAKQILARGGYTLRDGKLINPSGQPVPPLTQVTQSTTTGSGAEYLASVWRQLGLEINIQNVIPVTYGIAVVGANFDIAIGQGQRDTPDANSYIFFQSGPRTTEGGTNRSNAGAGDPVYYREARLAVATTGKESCQHYDKMIQRQFEGAYLRGMGQQYLFSFYRPGVDFLFSTPLEPYAFRKQ